MGITTLLNRAVEKWPKNIAIRFQTQSLNYTELQKNVNALAQGLMHKGIKKGDIIGGYLLSNPEFAILYLACFRIGAIVLPMSFRLTGEKLAYLIDYAKPKLIISQDVLLSQLSAAKPIYQEWELCTLEQDWQNLLENNNVAPPFPIIEEEAVATYFSTSGTTGFPKLAIHKHKNFIANAKNHALLFRYTEKDVTLAPLAICFNLTFGHQFMASLYSGATLELLATFEPSEVLKRISSGEVTLLYMVSAMYSEVIKLIGKAQPLTHKLRACVAGGESTSLATQQKFKSLFGFYINDGIGMTELLFYGMNMHPEQKPGSQGRAVKGAFIKIMNPQGDSPVTTGEMGEIWVRSEAMFAGYLDKPEQIAKTLIDGFVRTGDLGLLDEEDYLWFRGRISSLIHIQGQEVAPMEIEAAFYQYPDVLGAAVFQANQKIIAFVSLNSKTATSIAELKNFIAKHLEAFKIPDRIILLDALPKGISNKIDRLVLQEAANQVE